MTLQNLGTVPGVSEADGAGRLSVNADTVNLGAGRQAIGGFDSVHLSARQQVVLSGAGDNALAVFPKMAERLRAG